MPHYLSIHHEPPAPKEKTEARWIVLAQERRAIWVKTWYTPDYATRYCWWDAPDEDTLEQVFQDNGVGWDEIIPVQLTTPSEWRWRED